MQFIKQNEDKDGGKKKKKEKHRNNELEKPRNYTVKFKNGMHSKTVSVL